VLERLRIELTEAGRPLHFELFKGSLTDKMSPEGYLQAAIVLGITPAAAKQTAYRIRKRYRDLFRAEVARTVDRDEDVDEEIGRLLQFLG
jgi:hypothetical protein